VAGLVAGFFSALIIALFLLIDLAVANGILTNWVPPQYGHEVSLLFARLDQIWLCFFKAEVVIGLIIGLGNLVLLVLLGVPHPVPLAIIMGTIGLIPTSGGILAAIPIVIVCLFFGSTVFTGLDPITFTVIVVILCVVYNQLVYTFVSPRISGAAVHIPAAIVVIGVLAALALIGILGALLIVPILGSVRLFVGFALSKLSLRAPFPDDESPPTEIPGFFSHMLYVKPAGKPDTR
jgi:predicted PurR-regulated permease PerM